MRTTTRLTVLAVAALATAGLAGCSAKSDSSNAPTATKTVTAAPAPAPATSSATPSASSTATTAPGSGTAIGACTAAHLSASIAANAGGGAAGSTYVSIVLTNSGPASCTLQGWPGVSFVGGGNGTQLGQAAVFDKTSPHPTVTIAPSGSAKSTLRVVQAANYSSADCKPTKIDGFRIYAPGQKASLFAANTRFTACASKSVSLLTVSALQ